MGSIWWSKGSGCTGDGGSWPSERIRSMSAVAVDTSANDAKISASSSVLSWILGSASPSAPNTASLPAPRTKGSASRSATPPFPRAVHPDLVARLLGVVVLVSLAAEADAPPIRCLFGGLDAAGERVGRELVIFGLVEEPELAVNPFVACFEQFHPSLLRLALARLAVGLRRSSNATVLHRAALADRGPAMTTRPDHAPRTELASAEIANVIGYVERIAVATAIHSADPF